MDLCHACLQDLPHKPLSQSIPIPEPGEGEEGEEGDEKHPADTPVIWSAFEYRFPIDRLIHAFKFKGSLVAGKVIAQLLSHRISEHLKTHDDPTLIPHLLIPVPLHKKRQAERGYNQAALLAEQIRRATGINIGRSLCNRTKYTLPQSELLKSERALNIKGAFTVNRDKMSKILRHHPSLHLAIIDDVITTGATTQALAQQLLDAGAAKVDIWSASQSL